MKNYDFPTRIPALCICFYLRKSSNYQLEGLIYVRVTVNGKQSCRSTCISCFPDDWNGTMCKNAGADKKNKELKDIVKTLTSIYEALKEHSPKKISAQYIVDIYTKKVTFHHLLPNGEKSIIGILNEKLELNKSKDKIGEESYCFSRTIIEWLKKFFISIGNENLSYREFEYCFYDDLVKWLKTNTRTKKNGYLKKFTQNIFAGNQFALRYGYTKTLLPSYESFANDATETHFLSMQELKKLENWHFEEFSVLDKVRDMFVFSCYTGFQLCDIKAFSADFVELYNGEEWVIKPREKTGVKQLIPFFEQAKRIFDKYKGVFNLKSRDFHNLQLAKISELLAFDKIITNRCGRKTAGMIWLNSGISIEVVSKMLGHKNINTTQKYYAKILLNRIDRETKHLRQTPANEPAKHELKSLNELTEPQTSANLSANIPADFSKLVELLADAVAQKIKVA